MIGTLHKLARLLASDSVTVEAFVRRFGPIAADHGRSAALDLCCADARFSRVQLWRDVDTGVPSMLALDLAPTVRLTMVELSHAFGAYHESIPTPESASPDLIFQSVAKDVATTSLVVRTAERTAPLDDVTVMTIRLVREPRLD